MNTPNEDLRKALEVVEKYALIQAEYHEKALDENPHPIGTIEDYEHEQFHVPRLYNAKRVVNWCSIHKKKLGEA